MNFLISLAGNANENFFENLKFTAEYLPEALKIMAIGMGGIFIALLIIYIASLGLQNLFPGTK